MRVSNRQTTPMPDTYDEPILCKLCDNFSYQGSMPCKSCCPHEKTNFAMVSFKKAEKVLNDIYRHGWNDSLRQSSPMRVIKETQTIRKQPIKLDFALTCHDKLKDVLSDTYRQGWNDCIHKQRHR